MSIVNFHFSIVKRVNFHPVHVEMTDEDIQELLNIKKTRAYLLTRQMNENGMIEILGKGANKKYRMKSNNKL